MMPSLCVALASVGLCCNTFGGVKDISSRASSGESNISVVPGVWCAIFGDIGGESVGDGGGVFFLFFLELITSVHSDSSVKLFIWVPSSLLAKGWGPGGGVGWCTCGGGRKSGRRMMVGGGNGWSRPFDGHGGYADNS